ncbi:hypothetical protein G6F70_003545 [Rhizopus microsporus]|uniref:Replication protein A, subunit RPA32 n=1 Tax=Rhizopus microsporus TaxID=58291 RepID=A0A1X0S0N2_RHIZD|nr:hypothetical protein G6F71_003559 [Rhizopus microsporus]KAG1201006.1 hypothetical protein G6F70_003545 [Rhizopus microsporus]KAG1212949.1 hypothetical protein G6F69_003251 [Rhizopus microsporus]KAG1234884.1 hypothetical protein G6F67_003190 [Rhizopus microsporus]KAG1267157.1 hypothetical protein G6F68_002168 [Rhizopus microsporus]
MEGGGFMSNSFDGSSSQGNFARKPMSEQTLRPVTIRQIKGGEVPQAEGVIKIDGADCTQVTFVGIIRNISEQQMNVIYTIEDGTGSTDVRKWIEQNETEIEADERRSLVRDIYVRVYGRLAYFHNRITVAAFAIRPITDYNEITHHYLEAIYVHLTFTKPSKKNSLFVETSSNKGNIIEDRIMGVMKENSHLTEGVTLDFIIEKLKTMHTEAEIRQAMQHIENEGQVYNTIDEYHFKPCVD